MGGIFRTVGHFSGKLLPFFLLSFLLHAALFLLPFAPPQGAPHHGGGSVVLLVAGKGTGQEGRYRKPSARTSIKRPGGKPAVKRKRSSAAPRKEARSRPKRTKAVELVRKREKRAKRPEKAKAVRKRKKLSHRFEKAGKKGRYRRKMRPKESRASSPEAKKAARTPRQKAVGPSASIPPSPVPSSVKAKKSDSRGDGSLARAAKKGKVAPPPASSGKKGPTGKAAAASGPVSATVGVGNGPRILDWVPPAYPLVARRLREQGRVLLRLRIDASGQVTRVQVVKSLGFGLDEAAVAAVKRSRFQPATRHGMPVACIALLPVDFKLRSGDE